MTDINTVEIQDTDLFTGTEEDLETEVLDNETIVTEVVDAVFGTDSDITAFKVAKIINGVLEIHGSDKRVPPQMMYQYGPKGMIAKRTKGMKGSEIRYTKDEVIEYVRKYTNKNV
jgi:hypothetical protein